MDARPRMPSACEYYHLCVGWSCLLLYGNPGFQVCHEEAGECSAYGVQAVPGVIFKERKTGDRPVL